MPHIRGLLATVKIFALNEHYLEAAKQAEIGTSLANHRPMIGVCGMADLLDAGSGNATAFPPSFQATGVA
jgi:hypothetical protein